VGTYDQYKAILTNELTTMYVIEKAYPSEKKVKPIRWVVVLGSFLATLFLSIIVVAIIEKYKDIKTVLMNE